MKLEPKHITPYLPFGLKFKDSYAADVSIYTLSSNQLSHFEKGHIKPFLPILRPLSDLTKEIEVKGEKFVPYDKIKSMYPNDMFSSTSNVAQWSYRIVEKLAEWHIDFQRLIEEGLAIDINTLK
jgi:hypothetical protein